MEKKNITEWKKQIRDLVLVKGEQEDTEGTYRFWLGDLNGVVDFGGHTDILSILADTDGHVLVQVNTPDDMSTHFEYLDSLPGKVIKSIHDQVTKN